MSFVFLVVYHIYANLSMIYFIYTNIKRSETNFELMSDRYKYYASCFVYRVYIAKLIDVLSCLHLPQKFYESTVF